MSLEDHLEAITRVVAAGKPLVLVAPPGAGKSTRVAPALIHAGALPAEHPNVVLLQPRRVAARAVADRIAADQGWAVGREVGYQIRFEKRVGPETRIRVMTEGVLTRQLTRDPFLEGIGAVLIDEFHERSIHSDLALALTREVKRAVRPDLAIVVMSATLAAEPVAQYLGDAEVIAVEGRAYPVEIEHEERVAWGAKAAQTARAVREAAESGQPGDILVFLEGAAAIRQVERLLLPWAEGAGWEVLPLHGRLPAAAQDRAIGPSSRRKVILSTNVAETSLTIPGIGTVVDSGLAKSKTFDAATGIDRFKVADISKASADQRAGRAGRTGPGRCLRLWGKARHRSFRDFDTPEVHEIDMSATVLAIHAFGHADAAEFGWYESPSPERLEAADRLLQRLGAWDRASGKVTPTGMAMLRLSVHPRLARLAVAASQAGHPRAGATLAAIVSEFDFVNRVEMGSGERLPGPSDVLDQVERFAALERAGFDPGRASGAMTVGVARQIARVRDDLARQLPRVEGPEAPADVAAMLRWIWRAYPDRLVRRRGPGYDTGVMVGGRGVVLEGISTVKEPALVVAIAAYVPEDDEGPDVFVPAASAVEFDWLEEDFPAFLIREKQVRFDPGRGKVVGLSVTRFLDLVLREDGDVAVDAETAGRVLGEALAPRAPSWFRDDPRSARWLARLDFVRRVMPELGWPEPDDESFAAALMGLCAGCRSPEEVSARDPVPAVAAILTPPQQQDLRKFAPESLTLPNGRDAALTYEIGRPPMLSVRLQDCFGWDETPRIASGRVPVLLQLLAPNQRPVQRTDDLASFWKNTYQRVRKDLRGRYPKHAWPEDPRGAKPIPLPLPKKPR